MKKLSKVDAEMLSLMKRVYNYRNLIRAKAGVEGHRFVPDPNSQPFDDDYNKKGTWVCDPLTQVFKDMAALFIKIEGKPYNPSP